MGNQERSGWRDARLSVKRRQWGFCWGCDIDSVWVEYESREPAGIVEYKHERATQIATASLDAVRRLGDRAELPAFLSIYSDDLKFWTITPLNGHARHYVERETTLSEAEWVALNHDIRGISNKPKYGGSAGYKPAYRYALQGREAVLFQMLTRRARTSEELGDIDSDYLTGLVAINERLRKLGGRIIREEIGKGLTLYSIKEPRR